MTKRSSDSRGARKRAPRLLSAAGLIAVVLMFGHQQWAAAHAEPERAVPPISGVVEQAPTVVEIWFDEEVGTEGTTIQVIGPGGIQVDLGDATVDLQDPERKHVTVSLRSGLEAGVYTVKWTSLSGTDGDEAQGGYIFTVGAAAPAASAVASAGATVAPTPPPSPTATPASAPATDNGDFDSMGFGLSIAAGLGVAVLIFVFWRLVRPKNPKFRG